MTNDFEQRTRHGLGILAASVDRPRPPIDVLVTRATHRRRAYRTRTIVAGLLAVSLSGGIAAAVVWRTSPTREVLTSGTTIGGRRIYITEFTETLTDPPRSSRSQRVRGLCIDVFGPQGAGPACFRYDTISKGPQARVFKNNRATVNGMAHSFVVSFVIFNLPDGGLSKASVTAANQPDVALDYFIDNARHRVFALAYSDFPRGAGITTVDLNNETHRSPLAISRWPRS